MTSPRFLRTNEADGTRVLHLGGCTQITLRHWLLRRVATWDWADTRDVATLLAVTDATHVQLCRSCAPLRLDTVPGQRRISAGAGPAPMRDRPSLRS